MIRIYIYIVGPRERERKRESERERERYIYSYTYVHTYIYVLYLFHIVYACIRWTIQIKDVKVSAHWDTGLCAHGDVVMCEKCRGIDTSRMY